MNNTLVKYYGRPVRYAEHSAARLIAGLLAYVISVCMMNRYGYDVLAYFVRMTGIKLKTPYAAAFLQLLGVFIVMLVVCALIHQFHIFTRLRRSCLYGIFLGGYMFIYSAVGIVMELVYAEGFQSRAAILFSILYFVLVSVTEELVFRGIAADLLLQIFIRKETRINKPTPRNIFSAGRVFNPVPAVVISGLVFALAHAMNLSGSDVSGVLIQMIGAFVMGMFLTAVYYRSGNIYSVIILHIMNDIAAAFPVTILKSEENVADIISGYNAVDLAWQIPYVVLLIILLRPGKKKETEMLWKDA